MTVLKREADRSEIEQATAAFLAAGGEVKQVHSFQHLPGARMITVAQFCRETGLKQSNLTQRLAMQDAPVSSKKSRFNREELYNWADKLGLLK